MKKILLILGLLAILVLSGCTSTAPANETPAEEETTPEWWTECPDGTKIDASERCPDVPQEFSEATEKQIFFELTELQDKYLEEFMEAFEAGAREDELPEDESISIIAENYDTTEETIREIIIRGVLNDWPMPPIK